MESKAFPIVNDWAKGCYVARVTGPHSKYVFDRTFVNGTPIKSRRTLEYVPGRDLLEGELPAWFVMRDRTGETDLIEVTAVGWRTAIASASSAEVLAVFSMGAPGSPGAWDGRRCELCDVPISGVAVNVCDPCGERADASAGAPDLVPF